MSISNTPILFQETDEDISVYNKENIEVSGQKLHEIQPSCKMSRSFGTPLNSNQTDCRNSCRSPVRCNQEMPQDTFGTDIVSEQESKSSSSKRKRRERTTFTKNQVNLMMSVFGKTRYPDANTRESLSKQIGIPEQRIQVWFKNRRAKGRKNSMGSGYEDQSNPEYSYDISNLNDSSLSFMQRPTLDTSRSVFDDSQINISNLPVSFVNPNLLGIQNYVDHRNFPPNPQLDPANNSLQYNTINTNSIPPQQYPQGYVYHPLDQIRFNSQPNPQLANMYFLNGPQYCYQNFRCYPNLYRPQNNQNNENS